MTAFFPDLHFGWAFYAVLVLLTLVSAYVDWRWIVIPKWVSVSTLAAGVAFNLARGTWLGAAGESVWLFGPHGAAVGAVDGLAFALAGFAFGFAVFFLMWGLGICGG